MKTGVITQKTIASDDIKDNRSIMGMDADGAEMASYFLRDRIYNDKILAVIREYISNGEDEHVKHGVDKPLLVKLVSVNGEWVWSVRDNGIGLNDHDVRYVFGSYFKSTKSGENKSIGGFGVGSKSGHCYSDTFYITSHHEGTKTSYICTLGAGANGIPVGEIYEISKEPTTEQGIEIAIDVKKSDLQDFSQKTRTFVNYFKIGSNIEFEDGYLKETQKPINPIRVKNVGDYTFSSYEYQPYYRYSNDTYYVRMGGVVYTHTTNSAKHRRFLNPVIVDVPIGKLSVPLSRESIESTPLNEKVFKEIEEAIDEIEEEETSSLVTPKFGNLASGNGDLHKTYQGDWFSYDFGKCFPSTRSNIYNVGRILNDYKYSANKVCSNDTKHVIYIMPDIKSLTNWHKRLISALQKVKGDDYDGYMYIQKKNYEKMMDDLDDKIDITDCSFLDIKKLKLPKLPKVASADNDKFLVYNQYGNKDYYTAQELDEIITNKYFDGDDLEDDWYLNADDMSQLNARTIGIVKDYGTRCSFKTANSKKMIENLQELGWITPDSDEYREVKEKFDEQYKQERLESNAVYTLERLYFGVKPTNRIRDVIKNNPTKITRLETAKNRILNENSTRSRILKSMASYNYAITRQDLRKILSMK